MDGSGPVGISARSAAGLSAVYFVDAIVPRQVIGREIVFPNANSRRLQSEFEAFDPNPEDTLLGSGSSDDGLDGSLKPITPSTPLASSSESCARSYSPSFSAMFDLPDSSLTRTRRSLPTRLGSICS